MNEHPNYMYMFIKEAQSKEQRRGTIKSFEWISAIEIDKVHD